MLAGTVEQCRVAELQGEVAGTEGGRVQEVGLPQREP